MHKYRKISQKKNLSENVTGDENATTLSDGINLERSMKRIPDKPKF